jgi:hypothetical protein
MNPAMAYAETGAAEFWASMTEWHRAFSLSIPIPIATPTPIALRRCLDSVVWVIHEPLLVERYRNPEAVRCRFGFGYRISFSASGPKAFYHHKHNQNHPRQYWNNSTQAQAPEYP